jgi:hypothetical protein
VLPEPPVAVKLALPPEQMVGEFTLIVNDGPIVTVATAVPVQPLSVAVTVYDVVAFGDTVIGFVVAPVLHE